MGYILAYITLCVIIIFHELGHFLFAKKNDIQVNEFSLGLGPTIIGKRIGETKFSLKALPIGGACMMEGEDENSANPRAFERKSPIARISVVAAGPVFNFILAFIISILVIGSIGVGKPVIADVTPGYAAEEAGIVAGDEITKMGNKHIFFYDEVVMYSFFHQEEETEVTYIHNGEERTTTLKPTYDKETKRYLYGFAGGVPNERTGPVETMKYSALNVKFWIQYTYGSLKLLVTNQISIKDMAGPVGIVKSMGSAYNEGSASGTKYGVLTILNFAILISTNLGVINLLPLPALDGGRLVFLILEAIRKKKVLPNKEWIVHYVGTMCLFAFMAFIVINDID